MQLTDTISIDDLRELARRRLPRAVFDFFDGGAEDEFTLRDNRAAFDRVQLRPRVLVDVAQVDLSTTIVGGPSALPLAVAPTGGVGFGWPGGDIAIARAAAAAGVPYTLSTAATASIEAIAEAAPGRLWFQAYAINDKALFARLIERAQAAGYEGLMITVDLAVGGKRERDLRHRFTLPYRPRVRDMVDFALHPRWAWRIARHGVPVFPNLAGMARDNIASAEATMSSVGRGHDPSFDWEDLQRVRERWPRKLIVKGVAHPDDADRLVGLGVDAMVVSNHGGRQFDGGPPTLELLPGVLAAVRGRVPVLVDGGVRRGSHVLKALALGAQAVLIGRATLFGALGAGDAGAQRALLILRNEIERGMRLCGTLRAADVDASLLQP